MTRRVLLLMVAVACAPAIIGCGASDSTARAARAGLCLPSPLHLNPSRVNAGASLIVSSRGFPCASRYPAGHRYMLRLLQVGRAAPLSLGAFRVSRDGVFRAVVHIPQDASPGESYIDVRGSPFDECHSTPGEAASCAGYDAGVRVLRSR